MRLILIVFLSIFLGSCEPEPEYLFEIDYYPITCPGGCDAKMVFQEEADVNGYYHIDLDWDGEYYPWFYVDVEATPVDKKYMYNNESVVEARFDSDTSWVLGDSLVIRVPLFNPFGNYTQDWVPLPTTWIDVNLPQYAGTVLNIVQNDRIYFSKREDYLTSRRILGPFPPQMKGDTITVYMRVFWDGGENSTLKDKYSQKFIVE
jgi:hypothetical protein